MRQKVKYTDVLVTAPVTLINAFSVPADESERFIRRWKDNARAMARQPGMIRARLYLALIEDAEIRFINVAEWESGELLARARTDPAWRASTQRLLDDPELHVTPRPAVYQVAADVRPGDTA